MLKLSINRVRQPKQYSLEFAAEDEQELITSAMSSHLVIVKLMSHVVQVDTVEEYADDE